nr:MAG TPA: hypothetical protein [Caudoviricetes sp.]
MFHKITLFIVFSPFLRYCKLHYVTLSYLSTQILIFFHFMRIVYFKKRN